MNSFAATTTHCVCSCTTTTTTTICNFRPFFYLLETLSHCFLAVYKIVEKLSLICNFILFFYLLEKFSNWYFYGVFLPIRVFKKKDNTPPRGNLTKLTNLTNLTENTVKKVKKVNLLQGVGEDKEKHREEALNTPEKEK